MTEPGALAIIDSLSLALLSERGEEGTITMLEAVRTLTPRTASEEDLSAGAIILRLVQRGLVILDDIALTIHITPEGCDVLALIAADTIITLAEIQHRGDQS